MYQQDVGLLLLLVLMLFVCTCVTSLTLTVGIRSGILSLLVPNCTISHVMCLC